MKRETRETTAEVLKRRVRPLREKAGLSQQQLAELAGLDRPFISRIEAGKGPRNPSSRVVESLARSLGVSPASLVPEV